MANDLQIKLATERTDPDIARDVVNTLERHVGVASDRIKVTVKYGWVTLEGSVDWQYQKSLAESAVKNIKGALGVSNRARRSHMSDPSLAS